MKTFPGCCRLCSCLVIVCCREIHPRCWCSIMPSNWNGQFWSIYPFASFIHHIQHPLCACCKGTWNNRTSVVICVFYTTSQPPVLEMKAHCITFSPPPPNWEYCGSGFPMLANVLFGWVSPVAEFLLSAWNISMQIGHITHTTYFCGSLQILLKAGLPKKYRSQVCPNWVML